MTAIDDMNFRGSNLLRIDDLSDEQMLSLVTLAADLKKRKREGGGLTKRGFLAGKNIGLLFQKSSTRTRCAAVVAAHDEGAMAEYLGAGDIHLGKKESVRDTARVLGRMFDGILFRGFAQRTLETLAENAGVPVWNGLTDEWHPTQVLADLQTIGETFGHFQGLKAVFVGDGRNNVCNSFMLACVKAGMDVVNCCPVQLAPDANVLESAGKIAERNGVKLGVCHDPDEAVVGANIVYSDVWVSMGEENKFAERIRLLKSFQVDMNMMRRTGNLESDRLLFLHCLPAFHNKETEITRELGALEVTDQVFEAPFSRVFDQAENRMHTIKAVMVATLGG